MDAACGREVADLHVFLQDWLTGKLPLRSGELRPLRRRHRRSRPGRQPPRHPHRPRRPAARVRSQPRSPRRPGRRFPHLGRELPLPAPAGRPRPGALRRVAPAGRRHLGPPDHRPLRTPPERAQRRRLGARARDLAAGPRPGGRGALSGAAGGVEGKGLAVVPFYWAPEYWPIVSSPPPPPSMGGQRCGEGALCLPFSEGGLRRRPARAGRTRRCSSAKARD